jgi:hypothetical protein
LIAQPKVLYVKDWPGLCEKQFWFFDALCTFFSYLAALMNEPIPSMASLSVELLCFLLTTSCHLYHAVSKGR